jgi:hypothetical protein
MDAEEADVVADRPPYMAETISSKEPGERPAFWGTIHEDRVAEGGVCVGKLCVEAGLSVSLYGTD